MTDRQTCRTNRVGVVLAGGQSRRMGTDKAVIALAGRRLIDHVLDRLAPQTETILISGRSDYGTGHVVVEDRPDGPVGPTAGLWTAAHWLQTLCPETSAFLTVPVDGPFLPADLYNRLAAAGPCAVAISDEGQDLVQHPTFGLWPVARLLTTLTGCGGPQGPSLHSLAQNCDAQLVPFAAQHLFNINTPLDLQQAEAFLQENA